MDVEQTTPKKVLKTCLSQCLSHGIIGYTEGAP